ncbi:MAG: hypothetical protein KDB50_04985, partial [Mycobacterium sp.]|nr:hypothetical protein [Mycobacterium sp.]
MRDCRGQLRGDLRGVRYVGRVGALAVALGVGTAIASMPAAGAHTDDSTGPGAHSSAGATASSTDRSRRGNAGRDTTSST